ncbi:hypothetical protein R6Q59_021219 [Mikania micrantha]
MGAMGSETSGDDLKLLRCGDDLERRLLWRWAAVMGRCCDEGSSIVTGRSLSDSPSPELSSPSSPSALLVRILLSINGFSFTFHLITDPEIGFPNCAIAEEDRKNSVFAQRHKRYDMTPPNPRFEYLIDRSCAYKIIILYPIQNWIELQNFS